jgi:hypothetical protein
LQQVINHQIHPIALLVPALFHLRIHFLSTPKPSAKTRSGKERKPLINSRYSKKIDSPHKNTEHDTATAAAFQTF